MITLATGGITGAAFLLYARWSRVPAPTVARTVSLESPYKTEEDWMVRRIAEDLYGLAAFAAGRAPGPMAAALEAEAPASLTLRLSVSGKTSSEPLGLAHSVWSPVDYQPLASRFLDMQGARSASSADESASDESLLRHLLDRRANVIDDENWAISKALARQPAEPRLHEDAALVLGAFGLREAAGDYSDVRPTLCRMTAHLALARALRGSAALGLSGRYAEAVLSTLADREAEAEAAVAQLAAAAPGSPVQQSWCNALRIRITEDWRLLPRPRDASRLELFEWLRATQSTLSGERALRMLERAGVEPAPGVDWTLALAEAPSVGIGNAFLDSGLEALLEEARSIWSKSHGTNRLPEPFVTALNEPAQPFVSSGGTRVIAWGTWAALYQRHALHLLRRIETHERHMLGLPDGANRTVSEKTRTFSALTLFPLLAAPWEAEKKTPDPRILEGAVDLVSRHPELVTSRVWSSLANRTVAQALPRRLPERITWFTTGCPRGTSFEADLRLYILPRPITPGYLAQLQTISPRDYWVAFCSLSDRYTLASPPPKDVAEKALGERLNYDARAISEAASWAYERDPALVRGLKQRLCDIDADSCDELGAWCVNARDEACGVAAYERFVAEAADDVGVSNSCEWLLRYYLQHGQPERARDLARRAEGVGSARGILAMAAFLEATGKYAQAEEFIRRERERYPPDDETIPHWTLIAFYHRMAHVRGVRSYEAKFAALAKDVFPNGLERVEISSLQGPPMDGVRFESDTAPLRLNGMRRGDIAVAWDGLRVRNQGQMTALREFSADPDFKLIIWRDGQYLEIAARRVNRRFGMQIVDYRPKS